jgi:hypothetical protein
MGFFKNMLSSSDDVSSKRFNGTITVLLTVAIVVVSVIAG